VETLDGLSSKAAHEQGSTDRSLLVTSRDRIEVTQDFHPAQAHQTMDEMIDNPCGETRWPVSSNRLFQDWFGNRSHEIAAEKISPNGLVVGAVKVDQDQMIVHEGYLN
jgi:hypothetical protein